MEQATKYRTTIYKITVQNNSYLNKYKTNSEHNLQKYKNTEQYSTVSYTSMYNCTLYKEQYPTRACNVQGRILCSLSCYYSVGYCVPSHASVGYCVHCTCQCRILCSFYMLVQDTVFLVNANVGYCTLACTVQ